jgi:hypothetical protein
MHRKDFAFFWIFKKLFVFIIDSPVFLPQGSGDSPVDPPPWSHDSPVCGVYLNCFTKKAAGTKYIRESRLPCD